jgi:hypothetical protein
MALLFKIYAGFVLIISYIPFHAEMQIRELIRAFKNWKPKYTFNRNNEKWKSYWAKNVSDKPTDIKDTK